MAVTIENPINSPFKVGQWTVYPDRHLIVNDDPQIEREMAPNLMGLLNYLVANHGKVISRDELITHVWQGSIVSDESVSRSIGHLRKLLDDSAKSPLYIKTISKQGYQFLLKPSPVVAENTAQTIRVGKSRPLAMAGLFVIIIVVVAVTGFLIWPTINSTPPAPGFGQMHKVPLSSDQHVNRQPRFSPDGRFVISTEYVSGQHTMVLRDLMDDSKRVLFSTSQGSFSVPTFSPSGQELAFIQIKGEKKKVDCELSIYTFKTNQSRLIADCTKIFSANLSWTANGKKLIATEIDNDNAIAGLVELDIQSGRSKRLLFPDKGNSGYLFSRLSPSGNLIAFVLFDSQTRSANIGLYDLTTKTLQTLEPQFNRIQQVVWGTNDQSLYFSDTANTGAGIWHLDLGSQKTTFVYNALVRDFDVDNKNHRFVANINMRDYNIWLSQYSGDGKVSKKRIVQSTANEYFPSLSRSGNNLAYVATHGGFSNVWVKNLQTGQSQQLTHFKSGEVNIVEWARDDKKLAFTRTIDGRSRAYVIDALTPDKLFVEIEDVTLVDWHDDPQQLTLIYDQTKKPGVYLFDLATQTQTRLLQEAVYRIVTVQANHYVVQKSRNSGLYQLFLPQDKTEGNADWQRLPNIKVVKDWQVRGTDLSVLIDNDDSRQEFWIMSLPTLKERDELYPIVQFGLQKNFVLDSEKQRYFYVQNDNLRMDLFLIEPMRLQ